jgi:hypothetical protein
MDANTEHARVERAVRKQHALALLQSGKAKTMKEAMDAASAFSLSPLPPGVRERLTGGTRKVSKVPPEMTVKDYVEFLAGEPLFEEVPSQAPADAPAPDCIGGTRITGVSVKLAKPVAEQLEKITPSVDSGADDC